MDLTYPFYILSVIVLLLYFYSKWKFSYWKSRNVHHLKPIFLYGNLKETTTTGKTTHLSEIMSRLYNEVKAKGSAYGGFYSYWTPDFIPVDLELIKCILHKDFTYFRNHKSYVNEEKDPLSAHLFNLRDEKWKNLRSKLTPTFTSGKMKMMFQTIVDCTTGLKEILKESITINEPVDIKEILSRFTIDVIGSVAFGIEINSLKNPNSDFVKYGKATFTNTFWKRIKFMIFAVFPRCITKFFKLVPQDIESFYINLVKDTVSYREKNNVYRKDFMHLLIQLKNIGTVTDDSEGLSVQKSTVDNLGLTINEMAAQAFVFYLAGFETSATTMTFALLELSQNYTVQDKLREEINRVLEKHNNQITYEAINEMEYLEKVVSGSNITLSERGERKVLYFSQVNFNWRPVLKLLLHHQEHLNGKSRETLRKHPPISMLPRVCNKDYKIENSDLVIKTGTSIIIPIISIQRDPEYYPDPEKFDPERFSKENITSRPDFTYMPFGEGPRTCIGLRFGLLQSKVGLCSVLKNYRVSLSERTSVPIEYDFGTVLSVKGGVWLNLEYLN